MKIGVFGLGFMGSTHLKAYERIPQAEVAAVVSHTPSALTGDLRHIQGNIGGGGEQMDFSAFAKYTEPYEALKDPSFEAVDLCLPTNLHADLAIAALRAGKHVLVEKPMALTGEDCDAMIRAAEENGRILMVAQVLRFLPAYSVTARMLKAGELGPVRATIFRRRCAAPAWSRWLDKKERSGGGIFDLLIHDLDFCLHLFGCPEAVSASGYEDLSRGIDWVTAELLYPAIGGVVVSGGWHHPKAFPFSMEYTIVADGGTVEFDSAGVPPTLYRADGSSMPLAIPDTDGYQSEIEYFVDCCTKSVRPELCPPQESAAAVRLGRLIDTARSRKGEKIACSL
jgi:predicted dehydrogenase